MATNIADKKNNNLPVWGNEKTMNLNNLILTNILSSHYFKVNLYELKTYHEVIDEIYYKVSHLEPWEKGSRVTSGQTGMCGGVRGVGAGGIVSTAFCILYKLFTLKLTRKQVVGLINHTDSPYIRALGFMYIRYTQPPADLWEWYKPYLEDEEKIDVKAGGGKEMTIGDMLQHFLSKLEWFSTLFPRIPVPIQKQIEKNLSEWRLQNKGKIHSSSTAETREISPKRNHLDDDMVQGSYNNGSYKHTSDGMKNSKHRIEPDDEREREKRHKHDRERYEKSKHYHSGHGSRRRSRSPSDRRPHREDEKMHHSHHRDISRHHRHRNHSRDRPSKSRKYSPEHYSSSHSRDMHSDSRHSHKRHHH